MEQLIDNIEAAAVELGTEDFDRIDALVPPKSATMSYYDAALAVDTKPNFGRW